MTQAYVWSIITAIIIILTVVVAVVVMLSAPLSCIDERMEAPTESALQELAGYHVLV